MSKWVVVVGLLALPAGAFADKPAVTALGTCVRIPEPAVVGPADAKQLTAELKRHRPELVACYRAQLAGNPKLAGDVDAKLAIHADGTIGDVAAVGLGKPLEGCVSQVLAGLALPPAKADSVVRVPLQFTRDPKPARADRDRSSIRFQVMCALPEIQDCYERQLLAKPNLQGTVTAHFVVDPDGHVGSSTAEGVDPELASCIAQVMRDELVFPRSPVSATVNYPFVFHPAETGPGSATKAAIDELARQRAARPAP